jgi:hypothetical protein
VLSPFIGIGRLDALVYASTDASTRIFVTTHAILSDWLHTAETEVPKDVPAALNSDAFYTYAIGTDDMRIYSYAELPVTSPPGITVTAVMLAVEVADVPLYPPSMILVSAVHGDRVFILREDLAVDFDAPSICQGPVPEALRNWDEAAAKVYRQCFAEHVQEQSYYGAIVRAAQALVNRVAPN